MMTEVADSKNSLEVSHRFLRSFEVIGYSNSIVMLRPLGSCDYAGLAEVCGHSAAQNI